MSDYSVIIKAQLQGFDEIERRINTLASKPIDVKLNITGDSTKEIQSQLSGLTKQAGTVGKNIGQQINNGIKSSINLNNFTKGSTLSGLSASIARLNTDLSKFGSSTQGFQQVSTAVNNASAAFERFKQASSDYQMNRTDDNAKALAAAYDEVTESVRDATNQMREMRTVSSGLADTRQIANFQKSVQQFYDANTKMHKQYGNQVRQILAQSMNTDLSIDGLNNLRTQFARVQRDISAQGLLGKSFFDDLKRGFEQIGQFVGTYGAWMQVVDVFRNMVTEVINVDTAMTELRKVSEASASQIDNYFSTAAANAKELGATISDIINSTADWQKLGYNLSDSAELARLTTLYQNVGDNMTQESASESLVSTLQGFQILPEEAEHIVDAFNEVGNKFAIGSDGIGEALQRSSSSMNAAGNTLEETIGLVTAALLVGWVCGNTYRRTHLIAGIS